MSNSELTRRAALTGVVVLPLAATAANARETETQKNAALVAPPSHFKNREDFVLWVAAGNKPSNGISKTVKGLVFIASSGATTIADLPGWLPAGEVQVEHWPVVADGTTDDALVLSVAMQYCITHSVPLKARGKYGIGSQITLTYLGDLLWDFRQAKFVALPGFPGGGTRMISLTGGAGIDQTFEWVGGHYDGRNQPNEGSLSKNDILNISVGDSARVVKLHPEYMDSGVDWRTSGGDSHIIINAHSIDLYVAYATGAQDLSVYSTSSSKDRPRRKSRQYIRGNFSKCRRAVSAKRGTSTLSVDILVEDCLLGWTSAPAEVDRKTAAIGTDSAIVKVTSKRCEFPISDSRGNGVQYHLTATEMGTYLPESAPGKGDEFVSSKSAVRFSGSKHCQAFLNVHGVNPRVSDAPGFNISEFNALQVKAFKGDDTQQSEGNQFTLNCSSIGSVFVEQDSSDRNVVLYQGHDIISAPTVMGASSFAHDLQAMNVVGTWIADLKDSSSNVSSTPTKGFYLRNGSLVTARVDACTNINKNGMKATDELRFPMPFPAAASRGAFMGQILITKLGSINGTYGQFILHIEPGADYGTLINVDPNGIQHKQVVDNLGDNSTDLQGYSITYEISS